MLFISNSKSLIDSEGARFPHGGYYLEVLFDWVLFASGLRALSRPKYPSHGELISFLFNSQKTP